MPQRLHPRQPSREMRGALRRRIRHDTLARVRMRPTAVLTGSVLCCAAALIRLGALAVQAQGTTAVPQNPPSFRAGVNLVELDVSVLDKDRRPVTGLQLADFTVLDNGEARRIGAFSAVEDTG